MYLHFRAKLASALVLVLYVNLVNTWQQTKSRIGPYSIPENRALKKSLGYKEDSYLNFTELVTKYGYSSEEHTVITEDGYILTIFRIVPKCSDVRVRRLHPVLLMHGVLDSSDLWIVAGPDTGLGYVLAKNCYDVWAANHRGNRYSRKHVRLNPDKDIEYWNYSFDEHGNYDLPAIVDYILYTSKRPRLYYMGHSQGTTDFFAMGSLRADYNDKIRLSIHLAPVAWLGNMRSPIPLILSQGANSLKTFLDAAGYSELLAQDQILHFVTDLLCQKFPDTVCGDILSLSTGYKAGSIRTETLAVAFGHLLVGISSKDLTHFGQLVVSKKFQRYDEGRVGNMKRYGTPKPPKYNVSQITSPVVLINGNTDWISTIKDTNILQSHLPNVLENYVVPEKYWSHHNHLWGIKAPVYVFPKILNYFERFDSYT